MNITQTEFDALLRSDLHAFVQKSFHALEPGKTLYDSWYIEAVCHALEECYKGNITRLVITIPPRCLKSFIASVVFPAWVLGKDPSSRIICASYAQELSQILSMRTRQLMECVFYHRVFPQILPLRKHSTAKNTQDHISTLANGYRASTSVGGTLTGRGGDIIIIDDPHKAQEAHSLAKRESVIEWYNNSVVSRLDNPKKGCIIVIQQRLHMDDLAGHLLEDCDTWTHLNIPLMAEQDHHYHVTHGRSHLYKQGELLCDQRFTPQIMDQLKTELGSHAFAAQYLQNPMPESGNILKWEWFQTYHQSVEELTYLRLQSGGYYFNTHPYHQPHIIQSWDTAVKDGANNDYSVCTTWYIRNEDYYLLDVFRAKLQYPDLKKMLLEKHQQWKPQWVLLEDKASGSSLVSDLQASDMTGYIPIIPIVPQDGKEARLMLQSSLIEAGRVHLPAEALWLNDFKKECLGFPNTKHDDQIDSMTQFLGHVNNCTSSRDNPLAGMGIEFRGI